MKVSLILKIVGGLHLTFGCIMLLILMFDVETLVAPAVEPAPSFSKLTKDRAVDSYFSKTISPICP